MKIVTHQVNEQGLREIENFLKENHKLGNQMDRSNLIAWAMEAEWQADQGNPPCIEIKSWDSLTGRTQEFQISDKGIDILEEDVED